MTGSAYKNIYLADNLPPRTAPKSVKESKKWKRAILDAFQDIAINQFQENLKFFDYYRMAEGKLPYQELSQVSPHLETLEDLLSGVGVPTWIKHYDLIGSIVNTIVGNYSSRQFKYHVNEVGEYADSELTRHLDKKFQDELKSVIKNEVDKALAEMGLDPNTNKQFNSPEEQQAYIQKIQEATEKVTPKHTKKDTNNRFKTAGVQWGESTLEKDRELKDIPKHERRELRDKLLSGRCFRHYRVSFDNYIPETWSPKNVFFSKEIDNDYIQKGEYVGRLDFLTPAQVVEKWGFKIDTDTQKKLLGGSKNWGDAVTYPGAKGSIQTAMKSNFNQPHMIPYAGYHENNFHINLEDRLGMPLGQYTDNQGNIRSEYLPRTRNIHSGNYKTYASVLRDDFIHRDDLCMVTEVYFRCQDRWGFLTYEDEYGMKVTVEVTEDILPEFLKENNIKATFKKSLVDSIDGFEVNTLQWMYRPVIYKGVKVESDQLSEPIYVECEPMEFQIKGDSIYDVQLPVAGYVGRGVAEMVEPYQAKYNFCMNQIYNLLEKELGMFFLMDVGMIPSEYDQYGDATEALMHLRNVAQDTGFMPISTGQDGTRPQTSFNQFSTYNISHANEINLRIQMAEVAQRKAYEVIGLNPSLMSQPTKYTTAEGVKVNQEATFAQLSEIYNDYEIYLKGVNELHLAVAQFCQANQKDRSVAYTKSDSSIAFLKQVEDLPLRQLGIIPSEDGKKRKELETFKSYLLNTNTLGADTLELARLLHSDAFVDILNIAEDERLKRVEREQQQAQQAQQLEQQKLENAQKLAAEQYEREEKSKDKDRAVKLQEERISALGRAADKQSDQTSIDAINKQTDMALKSTDLKHKIEMQKAEFAKKERESSESRELRLKELKLKAQMLEERSKDRQSKEYIATINKN